MQKSKKFIGNLGEDVACVFLVKNGYTIITRNYRKKCGEIDIISKKNNFIHFIEVKTLAHKIQRGGNYTGYRPEENVHPQKLKRLERAVQIYLKEHSVSDETPIQIDVVAITLHTERKIAKIRFIKNIVD